MSYAGASDDRNPIGSCGPTPREGRRRESSWAEESVGESLRSAWGPLFVNVVDPIVVLDDQARIQAVNPAFETLSGWTASELLGSPVDVLVPPNVEVNHAAAIRRFRDTGVSRVVGCKTDIEILSKEGSTIPVELSVSMLPAGDRVAFVGVARDLRERRESERRWADAADRWYSLLRSLPLPVAVVDSQGHSVFVNAAWAGQTSTPEEASDNDQAWLRAILGPDRHALRTGTARLLETGEPLHLVVGYQGPDGAQGTLEVFGRRQVQADEARHLAVLVAEDVSDRIQVAERLSESERIHRQIVESALEAIVTTDRRGRVLSWNPMAESLFGWTMFGACGRALCELLFPERLPLELAKLWEEGDPAATCVPPTLLRASRKDGSPIHVELAATCVETEEGIQWTLFLRDATDRWLFEESARRTHRQLSELLSAIPAGLVVFDDHGITYHWNAVAESLFDGWSSPGRDFTLWDLPIAWDVHEVRHRLQSLTPGAPLRLPGIRVGPEPARRFCDVTITLMDGSEERRYLWSAVDVTEQRQLEAHLMQAQKLESIGQLAAGIAHEINTPTQYVSDNVRFLHDAFQDLLRAWNGLEQLVLQTAADPGVRQRLLELREDADLDYLFEQIPSAISQSLDGLQRVATIVRAMKEFSHPNSSEKTAVDLNRALESTINISRNEWKYVAEMETDFDPALPVVHCFAGELNQVFLNLIVNAAHAIADVVGGSDRKGKITVATRNLGGDWVEVSVSDTGSGIPEAIRDRIFDPFFTTKPVGKGTGQGLSIAYNVVAKHGGRIFFDTETGRGTTFHVQIPTAYEHANPQDQAGAAA
ncbi:MAG: PAS domain S-box protein [Fimbriimonadales bacterium]